MQTNEQNVSAQGSGVDVLEVMRSDADYAGIGRAASSRFEEADLYEAVDCSRKAIDAVRELVEAARQQLKALLTGEGGISTAEHEADCRQRAALAPFGGEK